MLVGVPVSGDAEILEWSSYSQIYICASIIQKLYGADLIIDETLYSDIHRKSTCLAFSFW